MCSLFEKYRPGKWSEVVGQDKAVATLQRIVKSDGGGGRVYFISGKSGSGKTSIARILAREIADDFCINEIDAGDLTEAAVKDLHKSIRHKAAFSKPGRVIVLNEIHGISKRVMRSLLTILEDIPPHAAWIFTTTADGADSLFDAEDKSIDASPFGSRCIPVPLSQRGLAEVFARHAMNIAAIEGLAGNATLKDFIRLANDCRSNLRMMLSRIEAGEFVDETALAEVA